MKTRERHGVEGCFERVLPRVAQRLRARPVKTAARVAALWVALAVTASVRVASAQAGDVAAQSDEDAAIRQGVALRREGRDSDAVVVFQRAYDRWRSPRAAAQLGLCEQALGRWVLAERHVREALASASDPWVQRTRETLESALRVAEQHLATIEILGGNDGSELFIDGERVGQLPATRSLRVVIGALRLEARGTGIATIVRTIELAAGGVERVSLPVQTVSSATATTSTSTTGERPQGPAAVIVGPRVPRALVVHPLVWAGSATVVAGAIATVVAFAVGSSIEGAYHRDCVQIASAPLSCDERFIREQGTLDALGATTGVGWGLVGLGAAVAGVGVGSMFIGRREEAPRVVFTGRGVTVSARF
jgi:hypothetical protein